MTRGMTDKPIWMPLNVADYIKDTRHFSTLEHGAYILLLMHAWTNDGALPSDKKRLRRVTGMSPRQWSQHGQFLLDFFTLEGCEYRHKRVDQELEKAGRLIEQKRVAGKASAAKRAERALNGCSTGVAVPLQREANQSQSQSQDTVAKATGGAAADDAVKGLFDQGVALLTSKGSSAGAARSFIGKCRRDHGDKRIEEVLAAAVAQDVSEPRAWISKALTNAANDTDGLMASIERTYGGVSA